MLGFKAIAISPRVEYYTLLWVELREYWLQFVIKATLIAIAPEDNRWMVHIAGHHLLYNLTAYYRFVCPMPTWLFTLYIET